MLRTGVFVIFCAILGQLDATAAETPFVRVLAVPGNSNTAAGTWISPDLMLTNRHVVRQLIGNEESDCESKQLAVYDNEFGMVRTHTCKKVEYCSKTLDFCVLRMMSLNGVSHSLLAFDLSPLNSSRFQSERFKIFIVQFKNIASLERQTKILKLENSVLYHCYQTEDGNSGSPIVDEAGGIIGLHQGIELKEIGCFNGSYSFGVPASLIYQELKRARPKLADELQVITP